MRIVWRKPKEQKIKVGIDTLEDLWYLRNVVEPGDAVYGVSQRRFEEAGKQRETRGEKKTIRVKIRVEQVEFHKSTNRLRLLGVIESGTPEEYVSIRSHHTLNVELGTQIVIEREWSRYKLKILEEAQKRRPKVIVLAVDKGEAVFGLVKDFGLEYVRMRAQIPGKDQPELIEDAETKFYTDVCKSLASYEFERCVVCGAGFWKDGLVDVLKAKFQNIWKKCSVEHTGSYGENAISEVLKTGLLHKLAKESKVARESALVEELLEEIAKSGPVTYGFDKVRGATEIGAVKTLLVTDHLLREKTNEVEVLLTTVENNKGEVCIISVLHDAGKQLESLGGVGAMLRYKIE